MGRIYSVKGWLEPFEDEGDKLMGIIKEVTSTPEYSSFLNNWKLINAFGYSEVIFFGATAKYADIMAEDVLKRVVESQIQFDGYFECIDEESENSWGLRIVDSKFTKSKIE